MGDLRSERMSMGRKPAFRRAHMIAFCFKGNTRSQSNRFVRNGPNGMGGTFGDFGPSTIRKNMDLGGFVVGRGRYLGACMLGGEVWGQGVVYFGGVACYSSSARCRCGKRLSYASVKTRLSPSCV